MVGRRGGMRRAGSRDALRTSCAGGQHRASGVRSMSGCVRSAKTLLRSCDGVPPLVSRCMAQFGPLSPLRRRNNDPRLAAAFAYAAEALRAGSPVHARLTAMPAGTSERVELGGGVFAVEQVYHAKPRAEGFFESHRNYIDVQVIVEGTELMEVEEIARLTVAQDYDAERDLVKYATDVPDAAKLVLRAGDVALFFPTDGHMPSLRVAGRPTLVRKTVVKVPAA
ncbi:MAG: YhcH/YjgK/YiaL family protein [Opitutus sp.]|nr:YhcH/YjgK/YiaL family protein [Opitutus sp.]